MTWAELQNTPHTLVSERLSALHRRHERETADLAEVLAMSGDVAWGKKLKGKPPGKKPEWWYEDTPFAQWLQLKQLIGQGHSYESARQIIHAQRIRSENKKNLQALLN